MLSRVVRKSLRPVESIDSIRVDHGEQANKGCQYDNVGRNHFTEVQGKVKTVAHGKNIECIEGGAPSGMDVSKSDGVGWELNTKSTNTLINTKDYTMAASGKGMMSAAGSEFKITCNNGIYLN